MGSKANRLRSKWQDYSGRNALQAEKDFYEAFQVVFENTKFRVRANPKEFKNIYLDIKLSEQERSEIYNPPPDRITRHGIAIDYAIDNTATDKTIYVEIKRQDGWVEGGERKDGRGNAHERCCKFFTPGLQKILRKQGNLGDDVLPFWVVFQGDIESVNLTLSKLNNSYYQHSLNLDYYDTTRT